MDEDNKRARMRMTKRLLVMRAGKLWGHGGALDRVLNSIPASDPSRRAPLGTNCSTKASLGFCFLYSKIKELDLMTSGPLHLSEAPPLMLLSPRTLLIQISQGE